MVLSIAFFSSSQEIAVQSNPEIFVSCKQENENQSRMRIRYTSNINRRITNLQQESEGDDVETIVFVSYLVFFRDLLDIQTEQLYKLR